MALQSSDAPNCSVRPNFSSEFGRTVRFGRTLLKFENRTVRFGKTEPNVEFGSVWPNFKVFAELCRTELLLAILYDIFENLKAAFELFLFSNEFFSYNFSEINFS